MMPIQRRKRFYQQTATDVLIEFDQQLRKDLIRDRDVAFGDDWWPGGEREVLLLSFGMEEFIQGMVEEEDLMPKAWKGDVGRSYAKVWIDEGKGILCARFPYKLTTIDEIREKIPKGKKAWNANDKLWEFSVETIDVVVDILTRNFDEVINLAETVPSTNVVIQGDPLLSLLDKDDIKAIYRMLASKYHPDKVGGDAGKMARINQLFSQVRNGG